MPPNINVSTRPGSTTAQYSTPPPQQLGSIMLRGTPPLGHKNTAPNYFSSNTVAQGPVVMGSAMTPQRPQSQPTIQRPPQSQTPTQSPPQIQQQSSLTNQTPQGKDPFADLAGLF
jgi:hypothetical protein